MLLRFKDSIAGLNYDYACNQVADVTDPELIADFLTGGLAEPADDIETAAVQAPEVAVRRRGRPRKAG